MGCEPLHLPRPFSPSIATRNLRPLSPSVHTALVIPYACTARPRRESCKLDLIPLLGRIRVQLYISQDILSDALPSHVVSELLRAGHESFDQAQSQAAARETGPPSPQQWQISGSESGAADDNDNEDSMGKGGLLMKILMHGLESIRSAGSSSREAEAEDELHWSSAPQLDLNELLLEADAPEPSFAPAAKGRGGKSGGLSRLRAARGSLDHQPPSNSSPVAGGARLPADFYARPCRKPLVAPTHHECVTVFFSDIVGFSSWAHRCGSIGSFWLWGLGAWQLGRLVASVPGSGVRLLVMFSGAWGLGSFIAWEIPGLGVTSHSWYLCRQRGPRGRDADTG